MPLQQKFKDSDLVTRLPQQFKNSNNNSQQNRKTNSPDSGTRNESGNNNSKGETGSHTEMYTT